MSRCREKCGAAGWRYRSFHIRRCAALTPAPFDFGLADLTRLGNCHKETCSSNANPLPTTHRSISSVPQLFHHSGAPTECFVPVIVHFSTTQFIICPVDSASAISPSWKPQRSQSADPGTPPRTRPSPWPSLPRRRWCFRGTAAGTFRGGNSPLSLGTASSGLPAEASVIWDSLSPSTGLLSTMDQHCWIDSWKPSVLAL